MKRYPYPYILHRNVATVGDLHQDTNDFRPLGKSTYSTLLRHGNPQDLVEKEQSEIQQHCRAVQ